MLPTHPYRPRFGRDPATGAFASDVHHAVYADEMHALAAEVQRIITAIEDLRIDGIGHVVTGEYAKGMCEAAVVVLEGVRDQITYEAQS